jgi:hypothetical protein
MAIKVSESDYDYGIFQTQFLPAVVNAIYPDFQARLGRKLAARTETVPVVAAVAVVRG